MILAPYMFKQKAVKALRGNWQTALLVSFFSGILITAYSLAQIDIRFDPYSTTMEALVASMEASIKAVPVESWMLYGGLQLLSFLFTPMLELGCNHYFVCRLKGEELGFGGLLSRARYFGKALLLSLYVTVKIILWSLLFIIPGIIAAIRYSQAFYYLAEDPSLSVREAVRKSKAAMQTIKMSYLILQLSFLGWSLLAIMLQYLLVDINVILSLVAYQFLILFVNTYLNGANAAFYLTIAAEDGEAQEKVGEREESEGF